MGSQSRITVRTRNTAYIAGVKKRFTALSSIVIHGLPYTPDTIVSALQAQMDSADEVAPARATWRSKVAAARTAKQAVDVFLPSFEQYVRNLYENDPEALAEFGLAPKPPRAESSATKAAAAEKSAATRAAGGAKATKAKAAGTAPASPAPAAGPSKS